LRIRDRLTALTVRQITEPGLHPDGGGLHLQISPSGTKSWILKFQLNGRARAMGLGSLHIVGLADARAARDAAHRLLRDGIDPIESRKAELHRKRAEPQNKHTSPDLLNEGRSTACIGGGKCIFLVEQEKGGLMASIRTSALAIVMAAAATLAYATPPSAPGNKSFLALGDSVPFGYITADGYAYFNANNFVGYPDWAGGDLRLDTANAACPGETSTSFISSVSDNGCGAFRANFPLHVSYTSSQLAFATSFLKTNKQTRLVTIGLGSNDVILLEMFCNGDPTCIQAGLPAVLTTLSSNMDTILHDLRGTGFRGVLIVVNYYSPDYTNTLETGLVTSLNQILAAAASKSGAVVADAFTAFQKAASTPFAGGNTCKAGLLNVNPSDPTQTTCDVHPSQSGHQLLADTIEATFKAASPGQ
jgi:lysophospholipase L1-like esterase